MPEYLAPGVFIEEVPPRLRAIEGVSTSTAGFVGVTRRGPVAGGKPTFKIDNIEPPSDAAPTLVTSFADFVRVFGEPLPLPDAGSENYLGHAVRGFFDNGGKRAYISRVVRKDPTTPANDAKAALIATKLGVVFRLTRPAKKDTKKVSLNSLRGIEVDTELSFKDKGSNAELHKSKVDDFDMVTGEVTLKVKLPADLDPDKTYISITAASGNGPTFHARNPGTWAATLAVTISASDRAAVKVMSGSATQILVATSASFYRGAAVDIAYANKKKTTHKVANIQGNTLVLDPAIASGSPPTFARVLEIDVTVADENPAAPVVETFRALAWNRDPTVPGLRDRHYSTVINARSRLVYVEPPATETADLTKQPTTTNGFALGPTTDGTDGSGDIDYIGRDVPPRSGLHALSEIEDVRIVAIPGQVAPEIQSALITHCEKLRYRFAVLDSNDQHRDVNDILADRSLFDTSYAALYAPWIEVADRDRRFLVPPSGHVVGIMARTDVERGVHKAPANEVVRGAIGLATNITYGEQEILNPRGVDAIRRLEGRGIRVWGARTLSSDASTKYVNVRRYLIFLEASLDRGTQWVVFEPNTPETWTRVTDSISAFLNTQWRSGALFGRKAEDAYFVRCDETTMTEDDIQNGRLICHIGVAIVRPAEFVIFRIEQTTGFAKQA